MRGTPIAKALVLGSFHDRDYSIIKWFIEILRAFKIEAKFLKDHPAPEYPLNRIQEEMRSTDIVVVIGLYFGTSKSIVSLC